MATSAAAGGVATIQPESINTPEGVELLRGMRPDLLVVAAYGQILSKDVLSTPTRGTINVHASLLPKYRGAAPVAYAILGGEKQSRGDHHQVTPGLDSGDIVLQQSLDHRNWP
ncbi:MAG: formyltransferase family protein [Gemmataceae bacterium]